MRPAHPATSADPSNNDTTDLITRSGYHTFLAVAVEAAAVEGAGPSQLSTHERKDFVELFALQPRRLVGLPPVLYDLLSFRLFRALHDGILELYHT
jgi:hypothetical protein